MFLFTIGLSQTPPYSVLTMIKVCFFISIGANTFQIIFAPTISAFILSITAIKTVTCLISIFGSLTP